MKIIVWPALIILLFSGCIESASLPVSALGMFTGHSPENGTRQLGEWRMEIGEEKIYLIQVDGEEITNYSGRYQVNEKSDRTTVITAVVREDRHYQQAEFQLIYRHFERDWFLQIADKDGIIFRKL